AQRADRQMEAVARHLSRLVPLGVLRYAPCGAGRGALGRSAMTGSIVLIHAVRSSRTMWKGQRRRLRERGYEVIAPDLPGHGRRHTGPFTLDSALAPIDEAVSRCPEPPLLVGLPHGGYLPLHWAGTHPGRLAGVVAADCTIVPGPATARLYGLWM